MRLMGLLVCIAFFFSLGFASEIKPSRPLDKDAWENIDRRPLTSIELDGIINKELVKNGKNPVGLCTDLDFYRRVSLDLTGKLPSTANLDRFLQDNSPDKRKKLVDQLLVSDDFSKYWANYWSDVIAFKIGDKRGFRAHMAFKNWMASQVKKNTPWDRVAREMITAEGKVVPGEKMGTYVGDGKAFLMLAHLGPDAYLERASEVSRIFLGIQIQCAQCHDHKTDIWKRRQFHQFAAYFARTDDKVVFDKNKKDFGFEIIGKDSGEHKMPSLKDPAIGFQMHPKFLDGTDGPKNANDKVRRRALAKSVTSKENPWFSAAYVNRIWGKLLGQGFYQPIDDIGPGPQKELVQQEAFLRLVGAFQGMNYNTKAFIRLIVNTEAYQRKVLLGNTQYEHLLFAGMYPSRLDAYAFYESLKSVFVNDGGADRTSNIKFPDAYKKGFYSQFKYDPSCTPDEVEGGVSQALWIMNDQRLNLRIHEQSASLVEKILKETPDDLQALKYLYTRILIRLPVEREEERFMKHRNSIGRKQAFEDLVWALINTTEFQSRR